MQHFCSEPLIYSQDTTSCQLKLPLNTRFLVKAAYRRSYKRLTAASRGAPAKMDARLGFTAKDLQSFPPQMRKKSCARGPCDVFSMTDSVDLSPLLFLPPPPSSFINHLSRSLALCPSPYVARGPVMCKCVSEKPAAACLRHDVRRILRPARLHPAVKGKTGTEGEREETDRDPRVGVGERVPELEIGGAGEGGKYRQLASSATGSAVIRRA